MGLQVIFSFIVFGFLFFILFLIGSYEARLGSITVVDNYISSLSWFCSSRVIDLIVHIAGTKA